MIQTRKISTTGFQFSLDYFAGISSNSSLSGFRSRPDMSRPTNRQLHFKVLQTDQL